MEFKSFFSKTGIVLIKRDQVHMNLVSFYKKIENKSVDYFFALAFT